MLFSKSGMLLSEIPDYVHIITGNFFIECLGKTFEESKKDIWTYITRNIFALSAKIFGSRRTFQLVFYTMKKMRGYDIVISYQNDINVRSLYYGCNLFALKRVEAKKKVAWIHADYSFFRGRSYWDEELLKSFDVIVNVSQTMKRNFDRLHLVSQDKSYVVYNYLPAKEIISKSFLGNCFTGINLENEFLIVTVCRMDKLKSVYELCKVAKKLYSKGIQFKWLFCGDGPEFLKCKKYIIKNQIEKNVILLGNIKNPYPYIRQANLFVSGSILETFGLSLAEALILHTPVITMRYDAVDEIIINNENGIIVENFDEMSDNILLAIEDKKFYDNLKCKAKLMKNYNEIHKKQLKKIIEE